MKPSRRLLLFLTPLVCTASLSEAQEILADFEGPVSQMIVKKVEPTIEPSASGEGKAATFTAEGYANILNVRLPRNRILEILEKTPILTGKAKASRDDNQGTFLDVTLVINSDISGEAVFSPVETAHFNPLTSADGGFAFDLTSLSTKAYPSFVEAAKEFAAGKGTFFQIGIVQHSPKGSPSKVTYDDIRLEPR